MTSFECNRIAPSKPSLGPLIGLVGEEEVLLAAAAIYEPWTSNIELLHTQERRVIYGVGEKRRREFIAGRVLARSLFAELRMNAAAVPQNWDKSPRWPTGIVGSITHTDDICVVAIARDRSLCAIGIDVEPRSALERDLWEIICDVVEIEELPQGVCPGEAVRWIFCAKEAYFKAQFPRTGRILSFHDMRVHLDIGSAKFSIEVKGDCAKSSPRFGCGTGRLCRSAQHIGASWLVAKQLKRREHKS